MDTRTVGFIAAGTAHPLIHASRDLFDEANRAGLGGQDMIAVIAAFDARAGDAAGDAPANATL